MESALLASSEQIDFALPLRALDKLRILGEGLSRILKVEDEEPESAQPPNSFFTSRLQGPLSCILFDNINPAIRDLSAYIVSLTPAPLAETPRLSRDNLVGPALETLAEIRAEVQTGIDAMTRDSHDPADLRHVLDSYLEPALATLRALRRQATEDPLLRERLYRTAAQDLLAASAPSTSASGTSFDPEAVEFDVFSINGRWFATWRNSSSTERDCEYVMVRIELNGESLSYANL
jgi:hypothetical protein